MKHVTELELIEYAAGAIAQPQKAAIEEHLAQCNSCRQICEQTKLVYNALGDFTAPQVSDLVAGVRQQVALPKRGVAVALYNLTRIAAAIVFAALVGFLAAGKSVPPQQDLFSILKSQSDISFAQPAQHIAMTVSGDSR